MIEETIKIIEKSRPMVGLDGTDFCFTILLKPKDDSLEIIKWENHYGLTDTEVVTMADKNILNEIRLNAAVQVFTKFYQDTYLK